VVHFRFHQNEFKPARKVYDTAAREARKIVEDGIATPEDVDKAMITGRNWPAGFFGHRGGIGKQW
jgi:3-hydroxyacyl-CoA dehydrogenase